MNTPTSPLGSFAVTALVPTFRRLDILKRCLTAIVASDRAFQQIIVVSRPDADPDTFAWLSSQLDEIAGLEIVTVEAPGVVAALNAGLEVARGEFIAIFDDDALVRPDWLDRILAHFSDPQVGCSGGRDLIQGHAPRRARILSHPGERDWWGGVRGGHHVASGPPRQVASIKGCNWILRKSAIGTLRLDTRLYGIGAQYCNESWFCYNLLKAGWKIILDPSALVDHFPAERADGARDLYSRVRCHDNAANVVATDLAFASAWVTVKYITHFLVVGKHYCPGLYYIAHALAKRPKDLPSMLFGGWSGFFDGLALAQSFRAAPPGRATPSPAYGGVGCKLRPEGHTK